MGETLQKTAKTNTHNFGFLIFPVYHFAHNTLYFSKKVRGANSVVFHTVHLIVTEKGPC